VVGYLSLQFGFLLSEIVEYLVVVKAAQLIVLVPELEGNTDL